MTKVHINGQKWDLTEITKYILKQVAYEVRQEGERY